MAEQFFFLFGASIEKNRFASSRAPPPPLVLVVDNKFIIFGNVLWVSVRRPVCIFFFFLVFFFARFDRSL